MAFKRGGAGSLRDGEGGDRKRLDSAGLRAFTGLHWLSAPHAASCTNLLCVCVCVCVEAGNHLNDNLRSGTYIRVPGAELICLFLGRILTRRRGGPPILVASLFLHLYFEDFSIPLFRSNRFNSTIGD